MILGDSDGAISMIDMRTRNASTGASSKGKRGAASNSSSSSSSGGGGGGFPSGGYGVKWEARCHPKKVQTVSLNPVSPHYLATATLDRAVKIFDLRRLPSGASASGCGGATFDAPDFPEVVSFSENYSVNCAMWNPAGDKVVGVVMGPDGGSKGNLRVYSKPHLMGCSQDGPTPKAKASACQFGAMDGAAASLDHDNKTGRYLPVFHAAWDPKNHDAFVCGSMTQPRIVEVFSTAAINKGGASFAPGKRDKKTMALGCKRVGVLGDGGEYLGSVQSRSAFHPFLDVVVCGNASGRVHIFK
jgi:WD40 repeat protein